MRIVLVANGNAGSFGRGRTPDTIRTKLVQAGFSVVPEPEPDAPLPERLRAAARVPSIGAVVVAGGDGTIACAAGVLAGGETALGLLPFGTMNLLAKDLGIPLDLDAAVEVLRSGTRRRIDVGMVNGEPFLINSVIGMPARVARHREAHRGRIGPLDALRLILSTLRHLGRYPRLNVSGVMEGRRRRFRLRMIAVVNNDYAEGAGRILLRERVDGGKLTLYLPHGLSALRLARLALGFLIGRWRSTAGLERFEIETLAIVARRRSLRVMNDGEVRLIASPLRYRILPRALTVIAPPAR